MKKKIHIVTVSYERGFESAEHAQHHAEFMEKLGAATSLRTLTIDGQQDVITVHTEMVDGVLDCATSQKPTSPFPWTRHGHLVEGCDMRGWARYKPSQFYRCGGPGRCGPCSVDAARIRKGQKDVRG